MYRYNNELRTNFIGVSNFWKPESGFKKTLVQEPNFQTSFSSNFTMSYPGYPTSILQRPKVAQMPAFQLGRRQMPARVTRCGWPTDAGKKTLGGLVVIQDAETVAVIKAAEAAVSRMYPSCELNPNISKVAEADPDGKFPELPICRLKFTRSPDGLAVFEYSTVGDHAPALGPPKQMEDMRNGHLIVAKITPRPWQRDGKCGVTLYANRVNCLGFSQKGPGAYQGVASAAEETWA